MKREPVLFFYLPCDTTEWQAKHNILLRRFAIRAMLPKSLFQRVLLRDHAHRRRHPQIAFICEIVTS
jgi:hypothetical protein